MKAQKNKKCMKIKKNQSSTKQKKEKISDIELNEKLYPKDKNQILSESKPEGDYSPDKNEKVGISFDISIDKIGRICINLSLPSQKENLLKKKLDSRTVFSQTKSLGSQMGKRWYEYENGKLGIILSKNI